MHFVWDEKKNTANKAKHHLSFEDARNVFADLLSVMRIDLHEGEARWQIMGRWGGELLLLVVHTMREADGTEVIRIISARKATKAGRKRHEKGKWV